MRPATYSCTRRPGGIGDQAWHEHISFHQPDIERLIREVVDDTPGIELRCGERVTDGRERSTDGVEVTIGRRRRDPRRRPAPAGQSSPMAGALRSGTRSASRATSTARTPSGSSSTATSSTLPATQADMVQFGRYTRPALWLRLPGDRVRMEFMLMPGRRSRRDRHASRRRADQPRRPARRQVHSRPPGDLHLPRPHRAAVAQRQHLPRRRRRPPGTAALRPGAVRRHPRRRQPRLEARPRRRGIADDALLDTYESERKPHATVWVETAANQAVIIQTLDPHVAQGRDAYIRPIPEPPPCRRHPRSVRASTRARPTPAGWLGLQPILADGTRLDDMVGPHFLVAADRSPTRTSLPQPRRRSTRTATR